MSIFTPDVNENNGRSGIIEIDNKKVVTPTYAPTKNEFISLTTSTRVSKKDYRNAKVGEYLCWLNKTQLWNLKNKDGAYNSKKAAFKEDLSNIDAGTKIIHFNFFDDVNTIDISQLEILLDLQYDAGASVIQIPNIYGKYDYNKAIEKALEWKKGKKIETSLMGVVCKISDLDVMTKNLKSIESVGINLSQFNKPLLVKVKNELKSKDVWVHGISAPTTYPKSAGTLGILVNYYGIDSISSPVINWKSAQGFGGKIAKMTDDEHSQNALKNKYFKPTDYETPTIGALKTRLGEDQKLSEFCTCPVCNGLTIKDLLQKPQEVNDNNRSHRVVSFLNESATYFEKLKNNGTDEYISSKPYAKKIIG